jgi:type II secretory pathway pseudopilin PulG
MITRCQLQNRTSKRAGYSLVEVTLALLVVAIGLTATFGLFPEGLKATRAAVNDTEAALFAEYVFTTLDLTAIHKGGDYGPQWQIADTDHFISKMLSRHVSPSNFQLQDGGRLSHFYWYPDYYGYGSGDYKAEDFQAYFTSSFTYTLELKRKSAEGGGVTTYALLKVWPGDWEAPKFPPRVFYREILPVR